MINELTSETFDENVLNEDQVAVIKFYATWCNPCKAFAPTVEAAAEELPDVYFGQVDVDKNIDLARRYNIMSMPTLVIFKDGEAVDIVMESKTPKEVIVETVKKAIIE